MVTRRLQGQWVGISSRSLAAARPFMPRTVGHFYHATWGVRDTLDIQHNLARLPFGLFNAVQELLWRGV